MVGPDCAEEEAHLVIPASLAFSLYLSLYQLAPFSPPRSLPFFLFTYIVVFVFFSLPLPLVSLSKKNGKCCFFSFLSLRSVPLPPSRLPVTVIPAAEQRRTEEDDVWAAVLLVSRVIYSILTHTATWAQVLPLVPSVIHCESRAPVSDQGR